VAAILRPSISERAIRSSFCLYNERGSTKNKLLKMKGKQSKHTKESPRLNLQLDLCYTQHLLFGLFGLHLRGLLYTLRLFKLQGVSLIFNCRMGNIADSGLNHSMGCVLRVVQVSLSYYHRSCYNGAIGITSGIVYLHFCNLYCHQVNHYL
jgi:hypothetical protein